MVVNYGEMVGTYIEKSKLSLSEISTKMEELGVKADRSYLSKLRNNPKYPASKEVNKALAQVTGGDEDALIFAAYMEKAPAVAKRYFSKLHELDAYLRKFADATRDSNLKELLEVINVDEKMELFKIILKDAVEQEKDCHMFLTKESNIPYLTPSRSNDDKKTMPIIGTIPNGRETNHKKRKAFTCVDAEILRTNKSVALKVNDDSMIGDRIYNNDMIIVALKSEVSSSDIALVRVKKEEVMLRKVKKQGDVCILSTSNPTIEPTLILADDVEIIGKVVEVKFQLP